MKDFKIDPCGPRTPEGLERSRRANWKHGHFSREAKAERLRVREAASLWAWQASWIELVLRLGSIHAPNRFTRRVQKFHTEIYNALQKWCQAHADPARLPEDQRARLVGALRHVANDFTVLAQRLDPEQLKEIVARYIDPEEAQRAENAIQVSPTAEPADVIEPDASAGWLVT